MRQNFKLSLLIVFLGITLSSAMADDVKRVSSRRAG